MKRHVFILLSCFMLYATGCSTIAQFDQVAYAQVTSVESDALTLMDKATEDYSLHSKEVDEVNSKLLKAYLYDKNRPKNTITTSMWELLLKPGGNLYGGFIQRWKAEKKLGATFISEAKLKVQENFDRIAQLESKKIKN
jgi:hypothetical protein